MHSLCALPQRSTSAGLPLHPARTYTPKALQVHKKGRSEAGAARRNRQEAPISDPEAASRGDLAARSLPSPLQNAKELDQALYKSSSAAGVNPRSSAPEADAFPLGRGRKKMDGGATHSQ